MIHPDNIRKLIATMRAVTIKQMEADKPKLLLVGLPDCTLEEYLLFTKMTDAIAGAFFDFVKSGAKKEPADAAPAAG